MSRSVLVFVAIFITFLPSYAVAYEHLVVNFDNVTSLDELASWGLTFSNVMIWAVPQHPSIIETPYGGARSKPNGICGGNCYTGTGSIYFDSVMRIDSISVWALSGPTTDVLSSNVQIEAFDQNGISLGIVEASDNVQYEKLTIVASGIRRLDLTCGSEGDSWDDMELFGDFVIGTEESSFSAIKLIYK